MRTLISKRFNFFTVKFLYHSLNNFHGFLEIFDFNDENKTHIITYLNLVKFDAEVLYLFDENKEFNELEVTIEEYFESVKNISADFLPKLSNSDQNYFIKINGRLDICNFLNIYQEDQINQVSSQETQENSEDEFKKKDYEDEDDESEDTEISEDESVSNSFNLENSESNKKRKIDSDEHGESLNKKQGLDVTSDADEANVSLGLKRSVSESSGEENPNDEQTVKKSK